MKARQAPKRCPLHHRWCCNFQCVTRMQSEHVSSLLNLPTTLMVGAKLLSRGPPDTAHAYFSSLISLCSQFPTHDSISIGFIPMSRLSHHWPQHVLFPLPGHLSTTSCVTELIHHTQDGTSSTKPSWTWPGLVLPRTLLRLD